MQFILLKGRFLGLRFQLFYDVLLSLCIIEHGSLVDIVVAEKDAARLDAAIPWMRFATVFLAVINAG